MKGLILMIFLFVNLGFASAQQTSPFGEGDVVVIVDGDPPLISISSPGNISYDGSIVVDYSVTEQTLDSVWYSLDNGITNVTINGSFVLDLTEDNYYLIMWANDSFGRIGSREVHFEVGTSSEYCGDEICSLDENCESCSLDCGNCASSGGSTGGDIGSPRRNTDSEIGPTESQEYSWTEIIEVSESELSKGAIRQFGEGALVTLPNGLEIGILETGNGEVRVDVSGIGQVVIKISEIMDIGGVNLELREVVNGEARLVIQARNSEVTLPFEQERGYTNWIILGSVILILLLYVAYGFVRR